MLPASDVNSHHLSMRSAPRDCRSLPRGFPQPLTTPMGRSLTHFLEMPASWQVSTTSVTSLYDSGASSITSFGLATLQLFEHLPQAHRNGRYKV